jgi:hypothetical protein
MKCVMFVAAVVGTIAGIVSGGCWIRAASIKVPLRRAILSGPRQDDVDTSNKQWWWNGMAAWAAAVAAICQAVTIGLGAL